MNICRKKIKAGKGKKNRHLRSLKMRFHLARQSHHSLPKTIFIFLLGLKTNLLLIWLISCHIISVCGIELKCIKRKWNNADNMCFAKNWVLIWPWLQLQLDTSCYTNTKKRTYCAKYRHYSYINIILWKKNPYYVISFKV